MDEMVEQALSRMTLREKVSLLSGADTWHTAAVERLGVPWLTMTDGPHGVRTQVDASRRHSPATAFPTGLALAASWNPALIERVGAALAEETRGLGCDVLLGPCVNIVRHPLGGRNFESYGEDPYLAGRIGVAFVNGVQGGGVGTSLKHFACNNQEIERMRGNSVVDERTLREIYLAQFEAIVKEARPWTVMCSYNRLNGEYASQNRRLLNDILREEWGFDGAVVSDWSANHSVYESVAAGLDIEMPGPAKYYGDLLVEAVRHWQIDEAQIDEAARRVLRLLARTGKLDGRSAGAGAVNTPEHQALAREAAEDAITLLKNDRSVLPLGAAALRSVAVIGPNAAEAAISGGGSAYVDPPYRVSPLDGLRARIGKHVAIRYERGCENWAELPAIAPDSVRPARGEGNGLWGEYFDNPEFAGEPLIARVDGRLSSWRLSFAPLAHTPPEFSVRWTGTLAAPEDGCYTLGISNSGTCRVYLDGELVLENANPLSSEPWPVTAATAPVTLAGGRAYDVRVEYVRPAWLAHPHLTVRLGRTPTPEEAADMVSRAAAAAAAADVALVFAGYPDRYETEGADRPDMALTGSQDALIEAVAAANPNTVVVLNAGAPVSMPWAGRVAAIVLAYYPGMENGNAVARVLLGEINPSGKLPVTFPRRLADTPAYLNYPGDREVRYGEGIFVGYRYYDAKEVEPLFPFGHGLSYTAFEYGDLRVPAQIRPGEPATASLTVTNVGARAGQEVIQLYVADRAARLPRPPKELKAFAKIALQPGETRTVSFQLDDRTWSYYDPERKAWVAEPGDFEIMAGSSSRDIRRRAVCRLAGTSA